jgi:hypothetical protein
MVGGRVQTATKKSNSNLTEKHFFACEWLISFACEWLINRFESLISDFFHLPLEMKITLDLLFFNFCKCVQKLWCVYHK